LPLAILVLSPEELGLLHRLRQGIFQSLLFFDSTSELRSQSGASFQFWFSIREPVPSAFE
jgi:hypothetical protein